MKNRSVMPTMMALLVLFTLNSNAHALSNEKVYLACKAYAESGFKNSDDVMGDGVCLGYVASVYDTGNAFCQISKKTPNDPFMGQFAKLFGFSQKNVTVNAGIQKYLNTIVNQPERWPEMAFGGILEAFKSLSPCK